jgi:dephospho-CoA kinase
MALTIGLTGTLGCGKSTVVDLLRRAGESRWPPPAVVVIDADALARQAVEPGQPALAEIARQFGPEFIGPDGRLLRRELGRVVFADRSALARLEAIVHPRVRRAELEQMRAAAGHRLIVLDVPLLYEAGMQGLVARVVVVTVGEAQRFARLRRRGMTEAEIVARLGMQWSQARKAALADAVIDNSGDPTPGGVPAGPLGGPGVALRGIPRRQRAGGRFGTESERRSRRSPIPWSQTSEANESAHEQGTRNE